MSSEVAFSLPSQPLVSGQLIEVCGIDGAGKTTFIQDLSRALTARGRKVVILKPLSGDPLVLKFLDQINALKQETQNIALHERIDRFKSDYFLLSFINYKALINQYLNQGYYVLSDRYLFSFKTYQECFNQNLINDEGLLAEMPKEKVTFLINVPIDLAIQRTKERGKPTASYENPIFLKKAQDVFLRDAFKYPQLVLLNGSDTRESNVNRALSVLEEK